MRQLIHRKAVVAGFICAAIAFAALPCRAADESAEKVITKAFTVEPGWSLSVDADQGDIQLLTGKQNEVVLVVEREVKGASESQAARILKKHKVTATLEGNSVAVETKTEKSARAKGSKVPELAVHIRVTVPKKFDARLETAGGLIEATGLQGAVDAKTAGGDMCFTNIHGLLNGQSGGGSIRAIGCTEKLQVRTAGGNIAVSDYTGPGAQADSGGGSIQVKGCTGVLGIKTSGGNISVENFTGPQAYGDTGGGSMMIELGSALLQDSFFRSAGGNITLKLADSVAVNLNATTDGGTITTAVPVDATVKGRVQEGKLEGKMNGGGPKLQLKTGGGNIEILKKKD